MSGIALLGAILVVAILNVAVGTISIQLHGDAHLAFVLITLFVGVLTYWRLNQPPR